MSKVRADRVAKVYSRGGHRDQLTTGPQHALGLADQAAQRRSRHMGGEMAEHRVEAPVGQSRNPVADADLASIIDPVCLCVGASRPHRELVDVRHHDTDLRPPRGHRDPDRAITASQIEDVAPTVLTGQRLEQEPGSVVDAALGEQPDAGLEAQVVTEQRGLDGRGGGGGVGCGPHHRASHRPQDHRGTAAVGYFGRPEHAIQSLELASRSPSAGRHHEQHRPLAHVVGEFEELGRNPRLADMRADLHYHQVGAHRPGVGWGRTIRAEAGWGRTIRAEAGWGRTIRAEAGWGRTIRAEAGWGRTIRAEAGWGRTIRAEAGWGRTIRAEAGWGRTIRAEAGLSRTIRAEAGLSRTILTSAPKPG